MGEKVLELFQKYGLAGFFFAIAINRLLGYLEDGSGLYAAILFAIIGSITSLFSNISKTVIEKLGESISDTLVRWIEISWVSVTSPFQRNYYKTLLYHFSDYRTHGLDIGNQVLELEQMFIPLGITSPESEEISAGLIQQDYSAEDFNIWDFVVDGVEESRLRHQALLAPPGSGKTTLLKHLIVTYVQNAHRKQRRRAPKLVPVFISLRELGRSPAALPRLIERQEIVRRCNPPPNWFERRLQKGQCLVMLDGFDEIADADARRDVSQWIEQQIKSYSDSYFLVTSRPLGYQSAEIKSIPRVLKVEPFTLKQIERFIHNWYLQNELMRRPRTGSAATRMSKRQARQIAQAKATDLFGRIKDNPPLAAMALNPLLLTMMTTVHNYRAVLPENRVRLYAVIYEVLIEKRQKDRDIYDEAIAHKTRTLLQTLALAMMEQNTQDYQLAEDNLSLRSTVAEILGHDIALGQFLQQTDSAHGLLMKKAEGVYEFAHESFQHYLAAVQIQVLGKEQELLQRVTDDWWFDTLYLYAAQKKDATPIVEIALEHSTVASLSLAYTLDKDGVPIEPDVARHLRQAIDEGLLSSDPAIFKLAAEVKLSNRLSQLLRLNNKTEIDQHQITQAEYQLFLDQWPHAAYPDHWTSDRFLPQNAQLPVTGVRAEDAQAFCDWLTQTQAKPELRFKYRLPRLVEVKENPSKEPGTGCWCADLQDRRVAGLKPGVWQDWQGQFSNLLRDYVERDRPHVQHLTQDSEFQLSLDLQSDTGFHPVFDPSLELPSVLQQVFALDLSRALAIARSSSMTADVIDDDVRSKIRTCERTMARRDTRSFDRKALLTRGAHQRDVQAVRSYLLLAAEFWQALADAHANLADNRQQGIPYLPRFMTWLLNYRVNSTRLDCITQRDRVMNLYAFFALLEARKEGKMPAWEGIRIVREAVKR
ncbi:MAG: NACHT domain-containing protein [Elainellaceae cyanobacterium]